MAILFQNTYLATATYFAVTGLAMILFISIFELVTKYRVWIELKKGNLAVAMATGGKIFGIANIFRFSIQQHEKLGASLLHASYGFLLMLLAYFIFEFMTPSLKIDHEIERDNRAIGLISMFLSIGFSYIIGASLVV
ncbi:DUF350 domain-containing protein [Brevibacillus sp. 7WMA2]|uniref:Putative membrane protein n=1 Tax=Brevibacillus laterosporus LMG 15441 TaxID=1042163 RepID=A0A075R0R3_BRELA|nr:MULTISPECIES: DUF350 domain-containing protein [Brevibacillus]AIG25454.1 putative membrane protein [Brevibacillus laterosporus LMG 15441]AUM64018.1 DUF350 domain-containing protein [Brevibacillus laterosporus]AYK06999.1 DUF350 domain-containing protein [Brevibacillus laterosporus]ERM19832.1 membrane protein [Brevibacillus laterosporus PE36]MCR8961987.1 DUF350 domain-containing protein [Brevibacillus laterosporus]